MTWPAIRPAVASAAAIVFLFSFTSFGVVRILGGPARSTLETEIYRQTADLLDLPVASVLALLQLAAVVAMLAVHGWLERRQATKAVAMRSPRAATGCEGAATARGSPANLALMAVLARRAPRWCWSPGRSGSATGYGLAGWRALGGVSAGSRLFVSPLEAVGELAPVRRGSRRCWRWCSAGWRPPRWRARRAGWRGRLDSVLLLPLGTSAVTVGFGFLLALDEPVDLRASPWLVPIAQAVVALPFVVRTLTPVLRSIDPRLREAAALLGASPRARVARRRPPARLAGAARRGRLRVRHLARRVRRHRRDRPGRRADGAHHHRPAARSARRHQRRARVRAERRADGAHHRGRAARRSLACRGREAAAGGCDAPGRGRPDATRRVRVDTSPSTASTSRSPPGEVVAVLGPSGSGKSTLLRADRRSAAARRRAASPSTAPTPPPRRRTERGVGMMFQHHALFPHLDVGRQRRLRAPDAGPARERRRTSGWRELLDAGRPRGDGGAATSRRCRAASSSASRSPARWRPAPRVLLLDEPLGSLDRPRRERLVVELQRAVRAASTSRSSRSPTTTPRRSRWPTGSSCSTAAASSRPVRRPRCGGRRRRSRVAELLGFTNLIDVTVDGGRATSAWGDLGPAAALGPPGPDPARGRAGRRRRAARGRRGRRHLRRRAGPAPHRACRARRPLEADLPAADLPPVGATVRVSFDPSGVALLPD